MSLHRCMMSSLVALLLCMDAPALAQATPEPAQATPEPATDRDAEARKKEEARGHFEKGLLLFDEEVWDAALAEFLRSREIHVTRAATKNAAFCQRKLRRFDEALDLYEHLLELPGLSTADKDVAEEAISVLRGLVGAIQIKNTEAGATIAVDGRQRGTTPAAAPLRVSAGSHVVRIHKEGFEPFETRIEVAGGQSKPIDARLAALTRSGRLRVVEKAGKVLDVVVDGGVVGKTPWEGVLSPGEHTVLLRGEGDLGTQPASVPVRVNQVTSIVSAAEELTAVLRVVPAPAGASIAVDGVSVGRGLWEGRLRAGEHQIEIAAEGFMAQARKISLGKGKTAMESVTLERDPTSPLWGEKRGRFFVEVSGDVGLSPSLGGDVVGGCTGPCSRDIGLGFLVQGRGGYRFLSGFMVGVDAGYLWLEQKTADRATEIQPNGNLHANPGRADDTLQVGGAMLGASAGLRLGATFPLTFRLGAGVLLGRVRDHRTGSFQTVERPEHPAARYTIDVVDTASVVSVYVAPEVRLGARVTPRLEVSTSVGALVLLTPSPPAWSTKVIAATDGQGSFDGVLLGSAMVVIAPGLGAKYEF